MGSRTDKQSTLGEEHTNPLAALIAKRVGAIIVDEAHHIAATGWASFRKHFADCRIPQFTATPYRREGKLIDGKIICEYPLHLTQRDGYFKKIAFQSVYEVEPNDADRANASAASFMRKEIVGVDLDIICSS